VSAVDSVRQQGRRAGRSEGVEWLGRAGLVAQGAIYALVALLAVEVALGGRDTSHSPDKQGALELVSDQPAGALLLGVLAAGFAAYALWRFAQAFVDRSGKGDDAKALGKRAGYFCVGAWYGLLAVLTVETMLGSGGSSGGSEEQRTAGVLGLPLGRELVLAGAGGFLVAAGWNVYRALSGKLEKHLRTHELSETERTTVLAIGGIGHLARAAVFGLIGVFLGRAAIDVDASKARGLDGALLELTQQPYGRLLLGIVAAGLFAFAVWCWAQARYREV
jgi:hypothetical protein